MKTLLKYRVILFSLLLLLICGDVSSKTGDLYLVIYMSHDGKTGHVGIAVDNYQVFVDEVVKDGNTVVVYDTVRDYSLTYFDLWGPNDISVLDHDSNLESRYYKLPRTTAEVKITPAYFLNKGLPHSYDYPCDALIKINTTASQDSELIAIAESLQKEFPYFNTRTYNCTDYIRLCLERLFNQKINATEFIPFEWSSTPNQFYKSIISLFDVDLLKDPGELAKGSFFMERIIKSN